MLIKPISLSRDVELLDVPVACIRHSNVHLLTARRNAWNSVMLNQYKTTEPAYSSVISASKAAESRRKPGTYFEIGEKPSLVLDLDGHSLVVIHLNTSQPFSSWVLPAAMTDDDSPITGLDAFVMFAGSRYREATSGWRTSNGAPDLIVGIAKSSALATSDTRQPIVMRRSSIQSGGRMKFDTAQRDDANAAHLERIIDNLTGRTQQKYPLHEIYLWNGEYFCIECTRSLYTRELHRIYALGWPVQLTEALESATFCSGCRRWFDGTGPENAE